MDIDNEIRKVENILTGRFDSYEDRKYWEDKLRELQIKKQTIAQNDQFFKSYERGVDAFKKYPYQSNYNH